MEIAVADMTEALDGYAVADACELTRGFLDVLTNWYIRRSRERFWDADDSNLSDRVLPCECPPKSLIPRKENHHHD